jgi:serine/threonine-protein kinase PpkA
MLPRVECCPANTGIQNVVPATIQSAGPNRPVERALPRPPAVPYSWLIPADKMATMAVSTPEYSPEELTELLSGLMPEIPGYRVMRLIGRGGMSLVYLGVQESLDRQVAIKVIRPDTLRDEVGKLRFEKEARTIAKLQHPCIVGIHEVGRTAEGLLFYVMPYLSRGHVGERDLTGNQPRVIEVLRALLWALDYAHVRGVVHRDVKPENVLFDNADRPVLADFGIAIHRDAARITGRGLAIGSSPHMAPEQARAERVDGRADLYSLGVLTYELLCGKLPFDNPEALALALMHAADPIPRLPTDKQHWQPFIDGAMAKSPNDRFADAQAMMAALDQVEAAVARARQTCLPAAQPAVEPSPLPSMRAWPALKLPALKLPALKLPALKLPALKLPALKLPSVPRHVRQGLLAGVAGLAALGLLLTLWPAERETSATLAPPAAVEPALQLAAIAPMPAVEPAALGELADGLPGPGSVAEEAPAEAAAEPEPIVVAPGELELAAARRQIIRHRLTQPANDNALASLRAAQRLAPQAAELGDLGQRWLSTATPYLANALAAGNDDAARALFRPAGELAGELQLTSSRAWTTLEQTVIDALLARLQAALQAEDVVALRAARTQAEALGIAASALEPYWSQPIITATPGERLRRGRTDLVLARMPEQDRAGLAVMAQAVTRDDYAAFVADGARPPAACRIRTARMTVRKRSWDSPGFVQHGDHPVVCVSVADAAAYAAWLGRRDGVNYRLPTRAEWQAVADYPAVAAACSDGRLACAGKGTVAVNAGLATLPGVRAMHGNVREWQADCAAGCTRQAALGISWRDPPSATRDDAVDPQIGWDDIGFRLVRDVARQELEIR